MVVTKRRLGIALLGGLLLTALMLQTNIGAERTKAPIQRNHMLAARLAEAGEVAVLFPSSDHYRLAIYSPAQRKDHLERVAAYDRYISRYKHLQELRKTAQTPAQTKALHAEQAVHDKDKNHSRPSAYLYKIVAYGEDYLELKSAEPNSNDGLILPLSSVYQITLPQVQLAEAEPK